MPARNDNTLKLLWTIAAMLFVSSIYLFYLVASLPDPPTHPLSGNTNPTASPECSLVGGG